jgi:hypothetical protein
MTGARPVVRRDRGVRLPNRATAASISNVAAIAIPYRCIYGSEAAGAISDAHDQVTAPSRITLADVATLTG